MAEMKESTVSLAHQTRVLYGGRDELWGGVAGRGGATEHKHGMKRPTHPCACG